MSEARVHAITVVNKPVHLLAPGEATFSLEALAWFLGCPSGSGQHGDIANLAGHTVSYCAATRSFSVSPSVLCGCGVHYVVEDSHVRWC